jgi:hypothetical protein
MFKSHPLYLVEGEKLDPQFGDATVDVIKARGADDGFDFFHFFKYGEILLKTGPKLS